MLFEICMTQIELYDENICFNNICQQRMEQNGTTKYNTYYGYGEIE